MGRYKVAQVENDPNGGFDPLLRNDLRIALQ